MNTKITLVVPEALQKELREQVTKDGYSLRGKSKWISEAIEKLLALGDFIEFVRFSDEMRGFKKVETVVISTNLKRKLDDAVLEIRKQHPVLEGVQSRIIRTSIVQRLLRS